MSHSRLQGDNNLQGHVSARKTLLLRGLQLTQKKTSLSVDSDIDLLPMRWKGRTYLGYFKMLDAQT